MAIARAMVMSGYAEDTAEAPDAGMPLSANI
jgi:hypothetical protein